MLIWKYLQDILCEKKNKNEREHCVSYAIMDFLVYVLIISGRTLW